MINPILITYRKFEKCPISSQMRELVGHVTAFAITYSGQHHFTGGHCCGMISDQMLRRMDAGEMLGSYKQDGATVVWRTEK
jgi:hypothetical protein